MREKCKQHEKEAILMVNEISFAIVLCAVTLLFPRVCVPDGNLLFIHWGEMKDFSGVSK